MKQLIALVLALAAGITIGVTLPRAEAHPAEDCPVCEVCVGETLLPLEPAFLLEFTMEEPLMEEPLMLGMPIEKHPAEDEAIQRALEAIEAAEQAAEE